MSAARVFTALVSSLWDDLWLTVSLNRRSRLLSKQLIPQASLSWFPKPFHSLFLLGIEVMETLVLLALGFFTILRGSTAFCLQLFNAPLINKLYLNYPSVCVHFLWGSWLNRSKTTKAIIAVVGNQNFVSRSLGNSELHHFHFGSLVLTILYSGNERRSTRHWLSVQSIYLMCKTAPILTRCCLHADSKAEPSVGLLNHL